MKHIAFLYDHVLDTGGAENHILSLIQCLNGGEFRFSIISSTSPAFRFQAEKLGAQVIDQPARKPLSPAWIADLLNHIQTQRIDLLHIHGPIAATPGRIAARLAKIPAPVTFHFPASRYHGTLQTMRARIGRALYITVDRWLNHLLPGPLIYVSQIYRQEEIRAGRAPGGKTIYIPNGINLAACSLPSAPRLPLPLIVLFAGRLSSEKGCDTLIQSLSMLPNDLPPTECLIAGQGPLRAALETQAQALSAPDRPRIRFLGFREDVNRLMSAADLFVLPSRSEAASLALMEALAAGLPSIVTAVGDSAQMVDTGPAGISIPPDDPAALAQAMARLLSDEPLRRKMSTAARHNAQAYDERETARQVLQVYNRLL
jgi:glycosyltransferase involved in cell wall biosynthesis